MPDGSGHHKSLIVPNSAAPREPFTVTCDAGGDMNLDDRDRMGFQAQFCNTGPNACARVRDFTRGMQSGSQRFPASPNAPFTFTLDGMLTGEVPFQATVALHGYDCDDGLVITSGSYVETNFQRVLRAKYGVPEYLVSTDRKRNYARPTLECDESDVCLLFEMRVAIVEGIRRIIMEALPGAVQVRGEIWPQVKELCNDLPIEHADAVILAACRVPIAGSRVSRESEYECTIGHGRDVAFHYAKRKRGLVYKGYVKKRNAAPDLDVIRLEISCLHRDAIVDCFGEVPRYDFSGAGALELAIRAYNVMGERCCELLDHIRAVSAGRRSRLELQAELATLHAIADGLRAGSGYTPGKRAQDDAARILNQLYDGGIADAVGLRRGTKVRECLEQLVGAGGPLVRGATNGVFLVAPEFGMGSYGQPSHG